LRPRERRLLRAVLAVFATGLGAFHALLLLLRLSEGGLDTGAGLRWLGAALLLGGGLWLRRRGLAADRRAALALGLAVLVLHAPVLLCAAELERAGELLPALPAVLSALALLGLGALPGRRSGLQRRRVAFVASPAVAPAPVFCLLLLAPRPPPVSC
jgi:hypothetical protein